MFRPNEPLAIFVIGLKNPPAAKAFELINKTKEFIIQAAKNNVKRVDIIGLEGDATNVDLAEHFKVEHKTVKNIKAFTEEAKKYVNTVAIFMADLITRENINIIDELYIAVSTAYFSRTTVIYNGDFELGNILKSEFSEGVMSYGIVIDKTHGGISVLDVEFPIDGPTRIPTFNFYNYEKVGHEDISSLIDYFKNLKEKYIKEENES